MGGGPGWEADVLFIFRNPSRNIQRFPALFPALKALDDRGTSEGEGTCTPRRRWFTARRAGFREFASARDVGYTATPAWTAIEREEDFPDESPDMG